MKINKINLIYFIPIIGNLFLIALFSNKYGYMNSRIFFLGLLGIQLVVFICSMKKSNIYVNKYGFLVLIVYIILQLVAFLYSSICNLPIDYDFHRILVFCILFYVFFIAIKINSITEEVVEKIFFSLIMTGIIAFIFNIVINIEKLRLLSNSILYLKYNGPYFSAFFAQRTECAFHAFLCCNACIYFMAKTNLKRYYILYGIFLLQCILTNARMPLAMIILSSVVAFAYNKTLRKNIKWLILLFILIFIINFNEIYSLVQEFIIPFFTHDGSAGIDTGAVRADSWTDLVKGSSGLAFIIGHGMGSQTSLTTYFSDYYKVGGYHSMYFDAFCQGGILLVIILIYVMIYVIIKIQKSNVSTSIKTYAWSIIIGYAGCMITDSVGSLFDFQVLSLISTAMVVGIPLACVHNEKV